MRRVRVSWSDVLQLTLHVLDGEPMVLSVRMRERWVGYLVEGRDGGQGQMAWGGLRSSSRQDNKTKPVYHDELFPPDGLDFDMKCAIVLKLRLLGPRSVNCTVPLVGTKSRVCSFSRIQERPIHPGYWLRQIVAHRIAQPQPYEQRRCTSHTNPNYCWCQTTIGRCIDVLLSPVASIHFGFVQPNCNLNLQPSLDHFSTIKPINLRPYFRLSVTGLFSCPSSSLRTLAAINARRVLLK